MAFHTDAIAAFRTSFSGEVLRMYLNVETDTDAARVQASYGEEKYRRLAALKARWDPDNVFRSNANIAPEAAGAGAPAAREAHEAAATEPAG